MDEQEKDRVNEYGIEINERGREREREREGVDKKGGRTTGILRGSVNSCWL